jgi:excisionase family DNA binding protein
MGINTLTSKKVIEILNISRPTFDKWIKERKLKGYKVGRKWLFKEDEIMAFIEKGANIPDEKAKSGELTRRKAIVDRILSKSYKIEGIKTQGLVRAGRKEREAKIG